MLMQKTESDTLLLAKTVRTNFCRQVAPGDGSISNRVRTKRIRNSQSNLPDCLRSSLRAWKSAVEYGGVASHNPGLIVRGKATLGEVLGELPGDGNVPMLKSLGYVLENGGVFVKY